MTGNSTKIRLDSTKAGIILRQELVILQNPQLILQNMVFGFLIALKGWIFNLEYDMFHVKHVE
ncbi:hypothetical protein COD92_21260 [Bacillus sp. AFS037270]|nr:hypothetical protein COD92_21260 [Bacillus sp. AFS037270]